MKRLVGARRGPAATGGRAAALARSGLLVVFAALLALPLQAQAQSVQNLVSNSGKPNIRQRIVGNIDGNRYSFAQGFTTGDNTDGYALSSVDVLTSDIFTVPKISIYDADTSGNPGSSLYNLINPASFVGNQFNTFTAPANATLEMDTEYFIVVENESSIIYFGVSETDSTAEDAGKANGWSISDVVHLRTSDSGSWFTATSSLLISVKGTITGVTTASSNANLSRLDVADHQGAAIQLSPAFAGDRTVYTALIADSISQITLTPTVADSTASIGYLDGDGTELTDLDTGADGHQVDLVVGDNVIQVQVTAEDGTTKTYRVTVTQVEFVCTAPDLSGRVEVWTATMTVGVNQIDEWFGYGSSYGALSDTTFDYRGNSYEVRLARHSFDDTLNFDLDSAIPLGDLNRLRLHVCSDAFDLASADDLGFGYYKWDTGDNTWSTGITVSLALSATPSSDATLSDLALSAVTLSPSFASNVTDYTASAANAASRITVTAARSDFAADIDYLDGDGDELTDLDPGTDGHQVDLVVGENVIQVKLTAEDGTTTETYRVTVTREAGVSTDATLSALTLSKGTLSPAFASDVIAYAASVGDSVSRITVTAARSDSAAGIAYLDGDDSELADLDTVADGHQVDLVVGANTIKVKVTAGDDATTKTYTVTVTRAAQSDTDATLSAIALAHDHGAAIALSPSFASNVIDYRASVPLSVGEITVTVATRDSAATVQFRVNSEDDLDFDDDDDFADPETVAGGYRHRITLSNNNVIDIKVTAGDGTTTKTYTVTVRVSGSEFVCTPPDLSGRTEVWTGTLTVGSVSGLYGYSVPLGYGALPNTNFDYRENSYTIEEIYEHSGTTPNWMVLNLDKYFPDSERDTIRLHLCNDTFDLGEAGGNPSITTYAWSNAFLDWSFATTLELALTADNVAPVFEDGPTASRGFDEDLEPGEPFGTPVIATDDETLVYSLEGTDAALFDIGADGVLLTRAGESYDHETKSLYEITVKADDGKGETATIAVTVNVGDVDEPPEAPAEPTVTPVAGSTTSLSVTWTEPANKGPDIDGYDLRYRVTGTSGWTDGPEGVTATTETLTGLAEGTSYEVQVQAINAEGDGEWSVEGTGRTGANTQATGAPAITGTAELDQTLSAGVTGISDANGKTKAEAGDLGYAYAYQWQRVDADGSSNPADIAGATQSTYTVISADVGRRIRVTVSFTDDAGYAEGPLTSNALPGAGTVTCDGVWCATLYVQGIGSGNRGCANSSAGNVCSNTAHLSEDAFTHDLTDYAVTSVQVRSDGELRLFLNPDIAAGSESLVLHAGSATFAFQDADTTGANSRYWSNSGLSWDIGDAVELKLTEPDVSTDATLSGLALADSGGDTISLGETFVPATTTYTASVANGIGTVTLTATKNDSNATVVIANDNNTGTPGVAELNLIVGSNTLTVTVTAQDGTTEQEYTITVTRARATTTTRATLVSNTNLTPNTGASNAFYAQRFVTGANASGYNISTVKVAFGLTSGSATRVRIRKSNSNNINSPGDLVATLTNPGNLSIGLNTFTAPANTRLVPSTNYWITVNEGIPSRAYPQLTSGDDETGEPGWSIGNGILRRLVETVGWGSQTHSLLMEINGTLAVATAATGAPAITGTASLGQTLSAGTAGISDANGTTKAEAGDAGYAYAYQWQRVDADGSSNPMDIVGATQSTYTVISADVGSKIRVQVNFRDDAGFAEGPLTSNALPAAGTVTCDGVWCATLTAQDTGNNNRGCANSSAASACTDTAHLSEDEFAHAASNYSVASVNLKSDGQLRLFVDPNIGVGIRSLVLHVGSATFAFEDANERTGRSRYWDSSGLSWSIDDAVELKLTEPDVSTDATLSGLALADSGGDTISLGETFVPATTTYTASVANGIETVTLTATKNDSNATVVIASDNNTGTPGVAELNLIVGSNTLTVTVTAEDTTTEREYTITVTRARATTTPADCEIDAFWCTTLTVGEHPIHDPKGYCGPGADTDKCDYGSLGDDDFTLDGTGYTVESLRWGTTHPSRLHLTLDKDFPDTSLDNLTLRIGALSFALADALRGNVDNDVNNNYRWSVPEFSDLRDLGAGDTITAQLFEGATNTAATGTPEISGTAQVGQVLTATAGTIADTDGLPSTFPDDYSVQWLRVDADGTSNEEDIAGEIAETYTLTDDDVGKKVKVKVSFTDELSGVEMRTSAAYPSSGTVAGTNTAPTVSTVAITSSPASDNTYGTGEMIQFTVTFDQAVTVVGTPEFEFCLGTTATVSCDVGSSPPARRRAALSSGSGTTALVFSYTVVAGDMDDNGIWIGDQTRTIKLEGGTIQGTVGGLDAVLTHAELGAKTGHKVNGAAANTPATGKPSITGTAQVGETLTAATTGITDADGKTNAENGDAGYAYSYQWVRVDADGVSNETDITGAIGSTYPPVEADVDKKVRVKVSFTDDGGTTETVTSDAYPSTGTIVGAGICGRTQEVQAEILDETSSISDCADVERHHLSAFTELYLDFDGITALAAGDFAGLTRVKTLTLHQNELTSLPEGVFTGLTSLEVLFLRGNGLTTLSAGVFEPLTALKFLSLPENDLRTLPAGVFEPLTALETLHLDGNDLTTLPAGVFEPLTALETLKLDGNGLTTLTAGVFDGLDTLETLHLHDNALDALPAGVFEPLTALTELMLEGNPRAPFAPEAVALPDDGTVSDAGGTVMLDGSSSDGGPWGTNVTYGWALPDPASGVTIDDDTSVTPEATIPALTADTELTFTLTVTGRGGANGIAPGTDTATVRVTRAGNTAPTAADSSVTIDEDTAHPFAATEFNFADTDPGDALVSVTVVTLPTAGALTLDGTAVTAGRVVPAADIVKLTFTPAANANGLGYASFTFRVSDGTDESASAYPMTVNVTAVNDPATGKPEISGTAQVGQPLTADVSGIMDADGLTNVSYTYQWYRETQGLSAQISGATLSTYTPATVDVGKTIKVEVSFTDDAGNAEDPLTSDATATVAAPGVTVSKTALTVTEQDSTGGSYTVVLDTEPTANVVVTVAGHAGTDVTRAPGTLTFTASNWDTVQTVTVTAGDDADTTDDSVALTHSAASADSGYSGIAIDEVVVTVRDNDTAQVTGVSVTSGNARLVTNWTAVDNATGYKVQWKSGSQGYNTGSRQSTVTSGTTTSHTITGLVNGTEYTVRVSATRTDANDGPPSAEAKGTPAAPGVTVSTTALTVTEQDTTGGSYTVVLDTEPTANVVVTVAGHAGTDVTPNPATLTFTTSNWNTAQTVTVTAGGDAGTTDDSVTLTHSAASTDTAYSGITIAGVVVTVRDNDTAQVTGVTVDAGDARLVTNWTAVDNATGYKVQWKSGSQGYNTGSRQSTVTSGTTTSHTITGLVNGTEYTVRVSATRTDANDGPPSAEAKGTPAVPIAPGVTVSTTALTVTEQDTTGDGYTVVLDTQPTANVTVTVAGHAGTDVTPDPTTLTFTSTTWSTAQTVTVTAGDDADTTDDAVTLTHSAASTDNDYSGITIAGVAVTVNDNDTAQVTGVSVTSGNARLVINWTAVDNATGYKVQWKSGGQDYNTGSQQSTVTSGTTTSHTITGLVNGTEYTVRVSATRTDANDGPPSAEAKGTPAVPIAPGVTVSTTALTVTEQDTTGDRYTVVLDTEPTANVTVTVAGHAGTDVTPNPTTLTFTTSNWDTAQTVTVTAGNDAGTTDDSVTLTHSAASTDTAYSGITIAGVVVTVRDNDTAQVTGVTVDAGDARLVINWTAVDNATGYKVQWKSGSQNYNTGSRQSTVTSGTTTSHTITGLVNGTEYTVRVSATRTDANDGPPSAEAKGTPAVPIAPGVTVSTTALTVTEQDSTGDGYTVVLDTEPTANVTVTVAGHAGTDVTPNPATLTFTSTTWSTAQTVTVTAGDDADTTDDSVALTHSAASADSGYSGIAIDEVAVTVSDNDTAQVTGVTVASGNARLVTNWAAVDNATGYQVQWKSGSQNYNTGSRQSTVTSGTTTSHTITGLANGTEYTVRVSATRTGANDGPPSAEETGTPAAPIAPGVTVSTTALTVTEQDSTGDGYTVVLDTEPTANVTVTVAGHAGTDVTRTPGTLTFTTSNWDTVQTVTVTAGDDADTTDDSVTLTHSAASTDSDYSGIAIPSVAVTVSDNDTTTTNTAATGMPTISGTAQVGEILMALTSGISDADGLPASFTYRWVRVDSDGTPTGTGVGSNSNTYSPTAADVGKKIRVKVSFTDNAGNSEGPLTSDAYPAIGTIAPASTTPPPGTGLLVSNTGEALANGVTSSINAQSFVTGFNAGGYTISAVQIRLKSVSGKTTVVRIREDDNGNPGDLVATLTNPASLSSYDINMFTAPPGTTLAASTTYWITTGEGIFILSRLTSALTGATAEIGEPGWSIGDGRLYRSRDREPWYTSTQSSLMIAIKGTAIGAASDDATLGALTVNDGTSDLTLAPAFATGTFAYAAEVGNAVTTVTLTAMTTDDGASVSGVTLDGTAIADRDFTNGITVSSLHAGDNEIVVTVTAENGDTRTYTVTVTRAENTADTPGVTVSETALTVTEGDTTGGSYTVVLDTQPTATVTVTVAGHAGTDVTRTPGSLTFTSTTWNTAQTVTVTAGDDADTTDDSVTLTHSAASTDNDYSGIAIDEVAVTVSDNDTAVAAGICERTKKVRDELLRLIGNNEGAAVVCADVTTTHLTGVTGVIDLSGRKIAALKAGDFAGLTSLTNLYLFNNALTTLPDDVFDDLTALEILTLGRNDLPTLPAGVFDRLIALTELGLDNNALSSLPGGVFDELGALDILVLAHNGLTTLPGDVFDALGALTELNLQDNALTGLTAGVFDRLEALEVLTLDENGLTTLPGGVFDRLGALEVLTLDGNGLTGLPAGVFNGLGALEVLTLRRNGLAKLPGRVFEPLTALKDLRLQGNPGVPFAPGAVALPDDGTVPVAGGAVTLDGGGGDGGAWGTNVTYSWALTTPVSGVTVTFDDDTSAMPVVTIPALPADTKLIFTLTVSGVGGTDGIDPATDTARVTVTRAASAGVSVTPTALTVTEDDPAGAGYTVVLDTLPMADVTVTVAGHAGTDLTPAPVSLTFTPSNWDTAQTVTVTAGDDVDTENDTVPLTHGAESTDGNYNGVGIADVAVTVTDNDLVQVTGVTVEPGNARLAVSWTAVGNATGYKVQWKSGSENYDTTDRQATIASGSTTSHTITGLANATRYTVRVSATRTGASDGPQSAEAMGRPRGESGGICGRTPAVRDALLDLIEENEGAIDCADVSAAHLAAITGRLDLSGQGIAALKAGDFAGLTGLTQLYLYGNALSSLPGGVFADLSALDNLDLNNNDLPSLPGRVFAGLTELTNLTLFNNELTTLPAGVFAGLRSLRALTLDGNGLTALPGGVFDDLTELGYLNLDHNNLTTLPGRVFEPLTALTDLQLVGNDGAPFAPAAVALPDGGTVSAGGMVTLDGSGSGGAWGTNVTYSWALTTPVSGVTFNDNTSATPVVTIPVLAADVELTFTLTVTGGGGAKEKGVVTGADTATVTVTPAARSARAAADRPAPLTARFATVPGEHDGVTAFTVEIVFSEAPSGMKNRTLRDALRVTGGAVTRVRQVNHVPAHRIVTVQPAGHDAVDIALPASPDCEAAGAICTEAGGRLETGLLTRVRGPAALRVADAEVHEGPGAVLAFAVTLDRATSAAVSVDYATSDGTAQAGSDYTAATGSVTFAPGETAKTVSVAVLDDSHDEGSETLTLTLSNPSGAYLADGVATGTIENTDAMSQAWIARFGRTVADQVLDAVDARLRAARTAGMSVSLAGQRLGPAAPVSGAETVAVSGAAAESDPKPATLFGGTAADAEETARLKALSDWLKQETGENYRPAGWSRSLTGRELLMGSSFSLAAETDSGGFAGLWGRMAQTRFAGREDVLSLDGDVTTGLLGADYASGRWTTGLVVSHSIGEGGYRGEGSGDIEASVTALTPWAGYAVTERLSVWGAAGYGAGELKLTPGDGPALKTDLGMTLAAAGARGALIDGHGPKLDAVGDARWVRTTTARVSSSASDGGTLASASASVTRLRLGLAGWWPLALGEGAFGKGATVTPRLALGVRHDGGDAETGFGADIGGGVALAAPAHGLTVSLEGRGVLTHEAAGLRDRGVAGTLAWNPPPPGRGPRLTLTQTLGAGAAGGTDALLSRTTLEGLAANDDVGGRRRLEARFGYGFGMFEGRFTMTPEIGLGLSDAGRDYSLGWRLTRAGSGPGSLELSLQARRRESANDDTPPEHGIAFTVTARW